MEFYSFSQQTCDDGEPATALRIAAQAVRDFNHRTLAPMSLDRPGWRFAPDTSTALGELAALLRGLPQALHQIATALTREAERGRIAIDRGTHYDDDPEAAIAATVTALQHATATAEQLCRGVNDAHEITSTAAYSGPEDGD